MSLQRLTVRLMRKAARLVPARLLERLDTIFHSDAARHYSQEGEDIILGRIFDGVGTGSYVDVGAHHPRRYSNTHLFYLRGWSGMNVEPNPEAIRLFQSERPRDINLQAAVSDEAGELTYFEFDEPALNTFDPALVSEVENTTRFRVKARRKVEVVRLDALLDRHWPKGRPIDFMSIDVEGFDLKVVLSTDWDRYRPSYVLVECQNASMKRLASEPMHEFLSGRNYELFAKTLNTCIYRDAKGTR